MARRARLVTAVLLLVLAAAPVWAVQEWYDYYLQATRSQIPAGRYQDAIQGLQAAVRLKPTPGTNEQTYGLQFVDYLPYYYLGVCHLKTGDFDTAMRMFNIEEDRGAIKRTALYRELLRLRTEADDGRRQGVARKAREGVDRLVKDASDLAKAKRFDEALARLAEAKEAAANLDPATQQRVVDLRDRVRAEQKELDDAGRRTQRIEQALAEGRRLLEADKPTDAIVRFDEVLALDPRSAPALEGKHDAQERILSSNTRQGLEAAFQRGKGLFDSGKYEEALQPLTDAAADPANTLARDLLDQARKLVEGVRQQKELHQRIEGLVGQAETLLAARSYPDATVKLKEALELDPENVRAKERLSFAERMTGEELFARWLPNQLPSLTFFEPRSLEVDGPTVPFVGVATDDRGVVKIQFTVSGRVAAEQVPPPQLDSGEAVRNVRFERTFPLQPGPNDVTVRVTDTSGAVKIESFRITRRLRLWETKAFLPSALGLALTLVGSGLVAQRARRRRAVRRRFNPYIAGAPVMDDKMFFGREKLMARMLNVLHHNSLMITGERRIGKTTFLYHLKKTLETDEETEYRFFPVLTDLQGVPESAFFQAVMNDVVEGLALSEATREGLRFRRDNESYDGRDFSHDLQRVIEELKTRTTKRVRLALLIDEVDALNEYSERINQRLRSIFMKTFSEHLVAIMSGVGIKRVWNSEGSPWYNFFDEIELSAFTREEAEALIRTPVAAYFRFEPEAVERILAGSELKPYVIQRFCIHALNRMLEQGRTVVTAEDVEAVSSPESFEDKSETPAAGNAAKRASA
jgi:tetratricopeptide (TPR) repeat protein